MKKLTINIGKPYNVVIDKGILKDCGKLIKEKLSGKSACIVTDSNVAKLYLSKVEASLKENGITVCSHVFEAGENSKNLENVAKIYKTLAENKITRSDFIVALGGGVTGDMAGFAAATYLRGIKFVQLPTTFLAAIDSSVGGKTGVNISEGKNLVGAFHQPSLVICDTNTFDSLGEYEMADGIAEAIKYGVIRDKSLFEMLLNGKIKDNLDEIICRSIGIKKDVVEKDELDLGERMILNFGHTFAHAIEKKTNHKVSHGHAVATGMVIACKLGEKYGITPESVTQKVTDCIRKNNLPTEFEESTEDLVSICLNDKKRMGKNINIIFADDIGSCVIEKMPVPKFQQLAKNNLEKLEVVNGKISGEIEAPASKSDLHRLIICASLAEGKTIIQNVTMSEDISATIGIMKNIGAEIEVLEKSIAVTGISTPNKKIIADCNESGSTLRFLLPLVSAFGVDATFKGKGKLPQRPIEPLKTQLENHGASFSEDKFPLDLTGKLTSGEYILSGDVSSQFISGLLFALPLVDGDSKIMLSSPLQSKPYVDMTINALRKFKVEILEQDNCYIIKGNQKYVSPKEIKADGDWSNGAFWIVGGAISGDIKVRNLRKDSLQGDKAICDVLKAMGADIYVGEDYVEVKKSSLHGTIIDATDIPDIIPILSVAAARAEGKTEIINAGRLRIKECDRLVATKNLLSELGANIKEYNDGLIIVGSKNLHSGKIDSCNDHRIAMSAAIASVIVKDGNVTIKNPDCVNKSYPEFYNCFKSLGGNADVIHVGE